jgi:hypothetical protein
MYVIFYYGAIGGIRLNIQNMLSIASMQYKLRVLGSEIVKQSEKNGTYDTLELSTAGYEKSDKIMTQSLLDLFNFGYCQDNNIQVGPNSTIIIDGIEYSKEQIPAVSLEQCDSIKATDNVVNIKAGKYYQFRDIDGNVHKLSCTRNLLRCPYSETMRGTHDNTSSDIAMFWNLLSRDATYINSYYSIDEIKDYLNQAGVSKGFFTVKVGEKQQDYLYTNGIYVGPTVLRSRYDDDFNAIKNNGLFREYKAGAVFEIAGEKYVMSENGNLDIPYGIDIYDIKYPPKSDRKLV